MINYIVTPNYYYKIIVYQITKKKIVFIVINTEFIPHS